MARVGIAVGVIGSTTRAALLVALGAVTLGAAVATRQAFAQEPADEQVTLLSADALAELVGPIALYPDDLVGIVLPASTYPLEVVQAARFLDERAKNADLKPSDDWDDSVVALLNYPEVVKLMNDDLDWTWRLGDAVINQRADVLDAIQGFRDRAYAAGNLRTDNRQVVENDDAGAITIKPADPEVIYVPYYEPERVVVYQRAPVYYYYPIAYPVYYYPYPFGYSFRSGYFWGVTSVFSIGWHTHFLYHHDHHYWGHPYHGRSYYDPFYYRRGVNVSVSRGGYVWEPRYRHGAQPFTRSDGRRFVGTRNERTADMPGSYRSGSGAVSRSGGQQQTRDPSASANRNRATPGTSPRVEGSGGTYRGGASGSARTAPQRSSDATAGGQQRPGRADSGSAAGNDQANQPARNREAGQQPREQSRSAPPNATRPPREAAPPRGAPAARAPGQYRSGGTSQRSTPGVQGDSQSRSSGAAQRYSAPQQPRQSAAPSARVTPPPAARVTPAPAARVTPAPAARVAPPPAARVTPPPAGERPTFGRAGGGNERVSGGGSVYRGESPAPQRAAPARGAERSDAGASSRGESRGAPSYRGDGGGGRNPNQSVRGGRATDR
jgi:hypothetical protein